MKKRYKIAAWLLGTLAVVLAGGALYLSHDSGCPGDLPPAAAGATMRAVVYRCYGGPDVLQLAAVSRPEPGDDGLLIRVQAASVNPLDWHMMRGLPYLMRMQAGVGAPKDTAMGTDYSGTVVAVGPKVTRFKVGDEVFGGADGAFAEYVRVRESRAVALKPANASFAEAAALPIAALTALQALRDEGALQAGQKVLINGASGGVGTYAVQIAKSMGADVTGVCSTRNVELVRSLGADRVIDYTREDFTQGESRYDLILDTVSTHSLSDTRRALTPTGTLVIVGGVGGGNWLGVLSAPIKAKIVAPFVKQRLQFFLAHFNQPDLEQLAALMRDGKLRSVIDRQYPLSAVANAMRYVEAGHARGKVVITPD